VDANIAATCREDQCGQIRNGEGGGEVGKGFGDLMTQMLNTLINFPGIIRFEDRRLMGSRVSERCKQGRLLSKTSTIARQGHRLSPAQSERSNAIISGSNSNWLSTSLKVNWGIKVHA
jgi:hypothetical protein